MDADSNQTLPDLVAQEEDQAKGKLTAETETIDLDQESLDHLDQSDTFTFEHVRAREFAKLFDALPTPLFLIDQRHAIRFLNRSCVRIDPHYQSVQGSPFVELFRKGKVAEAVRSAIIGTFAVRKPHTVTGAISIGKGVMYARISFRPLRMEKRRFLLALAEDLTAERMQIRMYQQYQKKLEEELIAQQNVKDAIRRSEMMYRSLFTNAPVGIMVVTPEGTVQFFNAACAGIIGYPQDKLKDKHFTTFVHPEDRIVVSQKHLEQQRSPGTPTTYGYRIIDSSGDTKRVQVISVTVEREGLQSVLMFLEDMTGKRQEEEEEAAPEVERTEPLGMLADGVAHDLNNVLTTTLGNISLGRASLELIQKASNNLASAERACVRAKELTSQLLTFSKGGKPVKQPTALSDLLVEASGVALRSSIVLVDFSLPTDLWLLYVDPAQISQVINNLVINADHALPHRGVLKIRAQNVEILGGDPLPLPEGDYVKIMFHDNRTVIPPDILSSIFDPRVTTKTGVAGLGLATAYSIVKIHGGLMTVESSSTAGTTFVVHLPATHEPPVPARAITGTEASGKGRVLIMDDEQQMRELASEALFHFGYEVETASEGGEAVALYKRALEKKQAFDAVLLDLSVPEGIGGRETARRILQIDPAARLIVLSGYTTDPVMLDHKSYGFRAMLRKPYTIGQLSEIVKSVISKD